MVRLCALLGVFALLLVSLVSASDVLDLTSENFDSVIAENPVVLVEFYAPWCGHCKNLAPKYEAAATQLKGSAPLAKVDCTAQDELCHRFEVQGYPTLKIFRDGSPSEYNGEREEEGIVAYMKKQLLPAVSTLEGSQVEEFSSAHRVVVVGFFASLESEESKAFSSAANKLRDNFVFAATTSSEAATAAGATFPGIALFKKFDEGKTLFTEGGDLTSEAAITEFVKENGVPIMDDIGPQNYATFMESGLPLAYLFVTSDDRAEVGPAVEVIAKENRGKMNFVYIDATLYGGHANNVGLSVGKWPAFTIHFPSQNAKFPFSGETITTEALRSFVADVLSGNAKPHVKTQPVPTEQGNVKVIVGSTFNEYTKSGKNVLLEFYAPWCGHCKSLAPIYEELGAAYAGNDDVVIAKMDATENDLPADTPFQIEGFPTIKFFKASGEIMDYQGDRSLADFQKFLSAQLSGAASSEQRDKDEL